MFKTLLISLYFIARENIPEKGRRLIHTSCALVAGGRGGANYLTLNIVHMLKLLRDQPSNKSNKDARAVTN